MLRREVVDWASGYDVAEPPIDKLRLALGEALANAVVHAFEPDRPGTVTVTVDIDPGREVRLRVADDGGGMGCRPGSAGLGLGLGLMRAVAETFDVRSPQGSGSEVAMTFALS